MQGEEQKLYRRAYYLSVFTIFYNVAEGLVSTWLGIEDKTLALFGFGADSFVEAISGLGILLMILRIWRNPAQSKTRPEQLALRTTGICFYVLAIGLTATAIYNIITRHEPDTTKWGIVVSLVSIAVMCWLLWQKQIVGRKLNSNAILSDASCTRVCIYMSLVLLASSLLFHFTRIGYVDSIGTLALVYFAVKEGREALQKSKSAADTCNC